MKSKRKPFPLLRGSSYDSDDPFTEVQLSRVLKELSFLRLQIDNIVTHVPNSMIERLENRGQLLGFFLEYAFPCLETVSKSLKATVRLPHKASTSNNIEFRHKRIVLLSMHEDIIPFWEKSKLVVHLLIQLEVAGKITTRPLAKCNIPLRELLVPPFIICRDFAVIGQDFEGTALIRIDLGSRVKTLMEKLESMRSPALDTTFVVQQRGPTKTRSRSSSRCRAHSARSEGNRSPSPISRGMSRRPSPPLARPRIPSPETRPMAAYRPISRESSLNIGERNHSASSEGSDSVFARNENDLARPDMTRPRVPISRASSYNEEIPHAGRCSLQLTVHYATGLPPVRDESGAIVSPSAFVSVRGREGELRSEVCEATRQPNWEWTAKFAMSAERRNLVVKIMHRGHNEDKPLGFVTISLPVNDIFMSTFEITDVSQMSSYTVEVPMITISVENVREAIPREILRAPVSRPLSARSTGTQSTLPESPKIWESSEEIKRRMLKSVAELDNKLREIRP
ncbi:unnamed protein product [Caenorhabditis auriculariae]|uniref:C2 domain-containing protein n=1 Tax=Caenorhabditis auriculariae TaxID=2777116 RepID=A0A8S1HJZ5_9PELO|nr:unnamed protein product [Caenorhabditis auriculariae]